MRDLGKDYYQPKDSKKSTLGSREFASHGQVQRKSLLDSGRFILEVDVQLLEEEVSSSRPIERAGDTLQSFERDVFLVKEELAIQKKESTKRHNELKQELQELKISLRASRSPVEFPACMEDLRQPMRLKQCGKGNL